MGLNKQAKKRERFFKWLFSHWQEPLNIEECFTLTYCSCVPFRWPKNSEKVFGTTKANMLIFY
jgi:hypothetical protein